jgi:DNA-binding transcriptional regulator YiaG
MVTKNKRGTEERFASRFKLQDATRQWCERYAADRMGRSLTTRERDELEGLAADPDEVRLERFVRAQAQEVKRVLLAALLQARAFLGEYAQLARNEVLFDVDAESLQQAHEDHGEPLVKRLELKAPPEVGVERSTRRTLIANYDRPHQWWWGDRAPGRRDLSVLSLLAGHFPSTACQRGPWSVVDVVNAEGRALDQTRKRMKPQMVGKRIRQRREELGLSQQQLARELRISRKLLNHYENNTRALSGPRLQAIARILKCEESRLRDASGMDESPPPPP